MITRKYIIADKIVEILLVSVLMSLMLIDCWWMLYSAE